MRTLTLIALVLLLAGCDTTPPRPEVRVVKVPVAVPCLKRSELPVAPKTASNQDLNALGDFDLVLQIAAERLDLLKFSGEQSAVLKACAGD